jgi:hypothetical protein
MDSTRYVIQPVGLLGMLDYSGKSTCCGGKLRFLPHGRKVGYSDKCGGKWHNRLRITVNTYAASDFPGKILRRLFFCEQLQVFVFVEQTPPCVFLKLCPTVPILRIQKDTYGIHVVVKESLIFLVFKPIGMIPFTPED